MANYIDGAAIAISQPAAAVATNASHTLVFDKTGYDHANIYLIVGTHATNGGDLATVKLVEHSSVTVATSMTAIAAFTGGTATSTSVGFVIPGDAETGAGCVFEFQVDLTKRKKKMALIATMSAETLEFASIAVLTRAKISADTTTKKMGITVHSNTSTNLVAKVITG